MKKPRFPIPIAPPGIRLQLSAVGDGRTGREAIGIHRHPQAHQRVEVGPALEDLVRLGAFGHARSSLRRTAS